MTQKRANSFDEFIKTATDDQRSIAERMVGDAKTLGIPDEDIKNLIIGEVKVEVKEEVVEKVREEKREDERRDERRDGERGERPGHELPGTPVKPGNELPSTGKPGNLPGNPPAGTKPVNPAEPKK